MNETTGQLDVSNMLIDGQHRCAKAFLKEKPWHVYQLTIGETLSLCPTLREQTVAKLADFTP